MANLQAYSISIPLGITRRIKSKDSQDGNIFKFSPKMNIQRYLTVGEAIKHFAVEESIKTVTEFGCGNFAFFYRYLQTYHFLEEINQVDVDLDRLNSAVHLIAWEQFRIIDYTRKSKLKVNIFHGNIAKKDYRTLNSDVVVGIELIEHMFSEDFEEFPSTVFEFIKPKFAVFTTPNHDFNELFENNKKFRHHDHKFEFSRAEFRNWADKIVNEYPDYEVQIYGIGEPPEENNIDDFGYCSQMAIFKKVSNNKSKKTSKEKRYTLIGSYEY